MNRISDLKYESPAFMKNPGVKFFAVLCVSLSLHLAPALGAETGGQRPAPYLDLGVGGMEDAMGGAAVAERNDVACAYWNPAGLTALRGFQIEDQFSFLSLGQGLHYFGLANGYRDRIFYGLSVIYYSAGNDLEARSGPSLEPDSIFGDTELSFLVSLAFRLNPRWSIGGNLKVFVQSFSDYSAYGFGDDFGIQYRITKDTTLGLMIQDPLSLMAENSTDDFFPPTFKMGIATNDEKMHLKGDFDLEWSQDLGLRPRLGVEFRPLEVIALRGGCWVGGLTAGEGATAYLTGGIGLLAPVDGNLVELDYALLEDRVNPGALLHQISLTGKFL